MKSLVLCSNKHPITSLHIVRCTTGIASLATVMTHQYNSIIDTGATSHILRSEYFASPKYNFKPKHAKVALSDPGVL